MEVKQTVKERTLSLVSVVIPAYNSDKYISRCIESVLDQSYKHLELIVVDDGSVDNTVSCANKFREADERVTVISQSNGGPGKARNKGIDKAHGDYIIFIDSDDYIEVDYIEKLVSTARRVPYPEIVMSGVTHEYYNPNSEMNVTFDTDKTWNTSEFPIYYPMQLQLIPVVANKLYRKEIIDKFDIKYNEKLKYYEDFHFIMDVISNSKNISLITSVGYHYCHNESSLSLQPIPDRWHIEVEGYKKYVATCKKIGIYDKYSAQIELFMWRCLRSTIRNELRMKETKNINSSLAIVKSICKCSEVQNAIQLMGKADIISNLFITSIRKKQYWKVAAMFILESIMDKRARGLVNLIKKIVKY